MKDRFVTPLKNAYVDGSTIPAILAEYDPAGKYMYFSRLNVRGWKIVQLDAAGIPINMHHGQQVHNPVTIAHYGLELYSRIVEKKEEALIGEFKNVVDWCLRSQGNDGGWPFNFDHAFFVGRTEQLKKPWCSALSQGMMISVLSRYNSMCGESVLACVERSLDVIERDVAHGGVKCRAFGRHDFYEEYPTTPPSLVLNGFMFCLIGLFDGAEVLGSERCRKLYATGIETLEHLLPMYDLSMGTAYDLSHVTTRVEGPNVARASYHRLHVNLLSTLNRIEKGRFDRVVRRWDGYLCGNALRTN